MNLIYSLCAGLPIIILLVVSLWKGVKAGVYVGLVVTSLLFFVWDSNWVAFPAAFVAALIDTVGILFIVFGAILLYQTMEQKGFIEQIQSSLQRIHPDIHFRFYFLTFFLTAFFESVAGFGTPGAIVPLLLISMGFPPLKSIASVLLIDGIFAVAGALGVPVSAGLVTPLDLDAAITGELYLYAAIMIAGAGAIIVWFVNRLITPDQPKSQRYGWAIYLSIIVPFVALSYSLQELTGVISAVVMATIAYVFFFTNKNLQWRPWLPYMLLVIILLIPKVFPPLNNFLAYKLSFESIFATEVSASLQPLRSPLIPFILAALFAALLANNYSIKLKPVLTKTGVVFLILFPSLTITRLMLASGTEMPTMVETLAAIFIESGQLYPLLSPFLGVLGAFITGSTTVSNVIFGPVQFNAALQLGFPETVILALQLVGGSLGNAVCLFNIIAASAVVGVSDYSSILKQNIRPVLLAALLCALVGYLLIYVKGVG